MYDAEPNLKRKNRSPLRVIVNQWGCLLGLVMLSIGVAMGLIAAIFIGPNLLGFDMTATALMERELMLAATDVDLDSREQTLHAQATTDALDALSTQARLNNSADLLAQTATRSAQNIVTTQTAVAAQSIQQQTQVANNIRSTQAQLNANATAVELDFRNTQAALGITPNSLATEPNVVASTACQNSHVFDTALARLSDNWLHAQASDWERVESSQVGLTAQRDGAWLLESNQRPSTLMQCDIGSAYHIDYVIRPVAQMSGNYWLLLAVNERDGLAIQLYSELTAIREVSLYQFELALLQDDKLSAEDTLTLISRQLTDAELSGRVTLQVQVSDQRQIEVRLNDTSLLRLEGYPIATGRVGIQLPQGASIESIAIIKAE